MEKLLAFAFLMVALASNGMVSGAPSADRTSNSSLISLPEVNSEFALRLYKQIAAQPSSASKNILISPLSVSLALSMLSLGAQGNTLSQIMRVLGYSNITNNDAVSVGEISRQLLERVNNLTSGINIGSSLHVQNGEEILEDFLKEARELYNAEIVPVDFREQQSTKDQINAYVSNKTNGRIPNFLTEPLSSDTLTLLLNYIVFKGRWLQPFKANNTYGADFHVDDIKRVSVQMMRRTGKYLGTYSNYLKSEVILMDFLGNTSLLILLPRLGKLAEVEQKLTSKEVNRLLRSLYEHYVTVYLPKMTLKTSSKLKSPLRSMGLEDAFTDFANFSGITDRPLKLSEVMQKLVLEVDEKEAQVSVTTETEANPKHYPVVFNCNRPFFLLIIDNYSRKILLTGRVMNPTLSS